MSLCNFFGYANKNMKKHLCLNVMFYQNEHITKCKAFLKKMTDQMNFVKRSLLNPLFVQAILIIFTIFCKLSLTNKS